MEPFLDAPLVRASDHPKQANALYYGRRKGELWSPLPGIFAQGKETESWEVRLEAVKLWAPGLAICGAAAAKLTWWPGIAPKVIELWGGQRRSPAPWLSISRSTVPSDYLLWAGDTKIAAPALSVVQLAATIGGQVIDEALRNRAATLEDMHAALDAVPMRDGNRQVRRLLHQSREQPWSALERDAHLMLDAAGIKGWKGNHELVIDGQRFFVDIALPDAMIAIELDGYRYHSDRETFRADRVKQNLLALRGWTVLRYTWETIDDLVPQLRRLLSSP